MTYTPGPDGLRALPDRYPDGPSHATMDDYADAWEEEVAALRERIETLEAIERYGFVVGPEFRFGPAPAVRVGWAVYADWQGAADDTYSERGSERVLAVATTLADAVSVALASLPDVVPSSDGTGTTHDPDEL